MSMGGFGGGPPGGHPQVDLEVVLQVDLKVVVLQVAPYFNRYRFLSQHSSFSTG